MKKIKKTLLLFSTVNILFHCMLWMKIKHTPIPLSLSLSLSHTHTHTHMQRPQTLVTHTHPCRDHKHLSLKTWLQVFCNSGSLDPSKKNSTKHIIMLSFLLQQGRSLSLCDDFWTLSMMCRIHQCTSQKQGKNYVSLW